MREKRGSILGIFLVGFKPVLLMPKHLPVFLPTQRDVTCADTLEDDPGHMHLAAPFVDTFP